MRTYRIAAERDGRWWVFAIPQLARAASRTGKTVTPHGQVRRAAAIAAEARDVIAMWTGEASEQIQVEVDYVLPDTVGEELTQASAIERQGRELLSKGAALRRDAISRLADLGWPKADIAVTIGLSRQRVSQLAHA
jgi:hypothetical protein